jgi:hypothetical protein
MRLTQGNAVRGAAMATTCDNCHGANSVSGDAAFPNLVGQSVAAILPARSFLIDGEAIVTNGNGLAVFDPIRRKRNGGATVLIAFDRIKVMSHSITVLA